MELSIESIEYRKERRERAERGSAEYGGREMRRS